MICNTLQKNNKIKKELNGFTIVELLVVIVVIAILTAITVVGYRSVSSNARKSAMASDLEQANKALNVYKETSSAETYPSTLTGANVALSNNATYSYTVSDDGSNYCLQGTTDGVTKSIAGNNQTVSDATCVSATNLITNGDFSQGTSGWYVNSKITGSVNYNEFIASTSTITSDDGAIYAPYFILLANHKYYGAASVRASSSGVYFQITNNVDSAAQKNHSGGGTYERLSANYAWTADRTGSSEGIRVTDSSLFSAKYFILIDMTSAFGSGNEPTAAQMDAILAKFPNSWFNGKNVIQVPTE